MTGAGAWRTSWRSAAVRPLRGDASQVQAFFDAGGIHGQASALASVAEAVAATDPDRAERIAQSITSEDSKASALVKIAKV